MAALTRSAKFFCVSPALPVLLRMAWPHRQAPEPEPAQHRANTALGQCHIEPRLDHAGQIHPAPAYHTILGEVWSFANQLCYCLLLLWSEPWFGPGRGAIGQPSNAFDIVANNPVAQRLSVHAAEPGGFAARISFEHQRQP